MDKLKSFFKIFSKKKKKFYPTPYRYFIIDWTNFSKRYGSNEKKIQIIESGNVLREEPYSEARIKALAKRIPFFDATQRRRESTVDIIEEIDPSTIRVAW